MSSPQKQSPHKDLRLLVKLQDLDLMIREASVQQEKNLGFKIESVSRLQEARQELARSIEPQLLKSYERLQRRYERAVVPIYRGVCLGCFMTLPTAHRQAVKSHESVKVCENCGRILCWLGD